jgi:T5SS/PEP-CTERM-associated repeat protein
MEMARRRGTISGSAGYPLALLLLSGAAAAQDLANWNTGTGSWNNAANWDCVVGGVSSHCIPGAGFVVTNIGGDITLDVNATVARISGTAGSLTTNGKTLTATDPLGIQITGGIFTAFGSSVINSGFLLAQTLELNTSTINGSAQTFNANIVNSTLGPLTVASQLTLAGSHVGPSSSLTIGAPSSISNSTIGGQFIINFGTPLTVDNGSTINATQSLIAQGSLTIQGGSTFNATTTPVFLGLSPGAAALDVTGPGSVLNLANTALELGQIANSRVTVEHGGSIAASGSGGNFLIGLGAVFPTDSTMSVNSGGTASANNITVSGSAIGSTGLLSLSDSSSSVTAAGELLVASGGVVNAANQGSLAVGSLRIQSGSVTIDSNASFAVTSGTAVLIGSGGTGTFTLQGGGTGSASGELVLGTSVGSSGTMTVADSFSKWSGSSNVSVGESGAGSLSVRSGGALVTGSDASGLSASIGTQSTGNGIVTVQGGDWTAHGALQIGAAGTGTLQLLQGGTLESGAATIGASPGSTGSVSVSGAASIWRLAGDLTVGSNGSGSLAVSGAGQVTDTNAVIGDKVGSSGSVTVAGLGSSWQNSGILTVGGNGGAGLTIDTGTVTAGGAAIGSNFAPVQVTVTNHGTLSVLGDVSLGGGGSTTTTIQNGGTFDSGVNATIGSAGGSTVVTVTGTDSTWTLHGAGNLTIGDKGSLLVMDGGTVASASITVGTNGLLNGQGGHIVGNIFNNGGTITPGDATGVMTITGNYAQRSGALLFEIDGLAPSQFDRLLISGLADMTGGSIDIMFGAGFMPAAGESFDLLSATLGLSLANVDFAVIGQPADLRFTETVGADGLQLDFLATAPVDEPNTWALLAIGAPLIGWLMRRRGCRTASV